MPEGADPGWVVKLTQLKASSLRNVLFPFLSAEISFTSRGRTSRSRECLSATSQDLSVVPYRPSPLFCAARGHRPDKGSSAIHAPYLAHSGRPARGAGASRTAELRRLSLDRHCRRSRTF